MAVLPAIHLTRRFALFAATVVFLLTTLRAGHTLWHFPAVEATGAHAALFLEGLRFDLALVGLVCIVPITLGPILGAFDATRPLARTLVLVFLVLGLALVLVAELLTPWSLAAVGERPGPGLVDALDDPLGTLLDAVREHPLVAGLGATLAALVGIAFWERLEVARLLRLPLARGQAFAHAALGGVVCAFAIWSGVPGTGGGPLSMADARVTDDPLVNELVANSAWKALATAPALVPR